MLVSLTEPVELQEIGLPSRRPEDFGSDFLFHSKTLGLVGVQRKTVSDLIASISDGRVAWEIGQMKQLGLGVWMIEGRPQWTDDGLLLSSRGLPFTKDQLRGVIWSLQSHGFWTASTSSIQESIEYLSTFGRWMQKERHSSLLRRPEPKGVLGQPSREDRQIHLMQSFEGVGYEKAKRIVQHYEGVPFQLREGVELTDVVGIGPTVEKKIRELIE